VILRNQIRQPVRVREPFLNPGEILFRRGVQTARSHDDVDHAANGFDGCLVELNGINERSDQSGGSHG
jgi:hypothetical protein